MDVILLHFPTLLLALAAGLLLMPLVLKVSIHLKWYDQPDQRKWHVRPVPATGGIAILLTLLATLFLAPQGRSFLLANPIPVACYFVMALVGIIDDRKGLSASLRFLIQIGLACWVASAGIRIGDMGGLMSVGMLTIEWQYVLTVVMIVGLTNAFNLIDGIDGLAGMTCLVVCTFLVVLGGWLQMHTFWPLHLALIGGTLCFLRYNWSPARLFLGDGGSLPIGFILATTGVALVQRSEALSQSDHLLVLELACGMFMGIVLDTLRVFGNRIFQGRSPFSADRDHLHHWYLKTLQTHKQAVTGIALTQIITVALTFSLHGMVSTFWIIVLQAAGQILVLSSLKLLWNMRKSYRMVRSMERMIS